VIKVIDVAGAVVKPQIYSILAFQNAKFVTCQKVAPSL